MNETKVVEVRMGHDELKPLVQLFMKSFNDAQGEYSALEVLTAALFAIGSSMKQVGVILYPDRTVDEMLTPLVEGYEKTLHKSEINHH